MGTRHVLPVRHPGKLRTPAGEETPQGNAGPEGLDDGDGVGGHQNAVQGRRRTARGAKVRTNHLERGSSQYETNMVVTAMVPKAVSMPEPPAVVHYR